MLLHLLTMSVELPNMDSVVSIVHMDPSWPQIYPRLEFYAYGFLGTIPPPWIYCIPQLDSIIRAAELIPTFAL